MNMVTYQYNDMNEIDNINIEQKHSSLFWVLVCIFLLHICLRNFFGVNSPDVIALGVSVLAFVLFSPTEALTFYMFLIPFKTGIGMHAITLAFCVIILFKRLIKMERKLPIDIFLIAFIIILEFLNSLSLSGNFAEEFRYSCYLLWMYIVLTEMNKCHWDRRTVVQCGKMFVFGFLIASLIVVGINVKNMSLAEVLNGSIRIGKTGEFSAFSDMIISFHVDDIAIFCLCSISVLIVLMHAKEMKWGICLVGVLYFLLVGVLSQCRTFIFSLLCILLLLLLIRSRAKWKIVLGFVIVAVLVFLLYQKGFLPVIDMFVDRFHTQEFATGNGRVGIFKAYNDVFRNHPIRTLVGFGALDYKSFSSVGSAHNGTQEMILGMGVLGSICLLVFLYRFIKAAQNSTSVSLKDNLFNYIPAVALTVQLQSTQFISQYHTFVLLCLMLMFISIGRKEIIEC